MPGSGESTSALAGLGLVSLIAYLSFQAGGFFPGTVALVAVALGLVLVVRVALEPRPLAGLSLPFVIGAVLIGLFAAWTLVSSAWSHAPARAIVEFDRVLLYLLAFVVFGVAGRRPDGLRWAVRAIAAAACGVCLCALVVRLLPDVWQIRPSLIDGIAQGGVGGRERLSYPITYWNGLGILAGVGIVASFGLTSDVREAPAARVLAAAALPVLGVALLLTFSRGAIAATAVGLLTLVCVSKPRALVSAVIAAAAAAAAIVGAYRTDLPPTGSMTAAATSQGHELALLVVACVVIAAAGRGALLWLDARLSQRRPGALTARARLLGLLGTGALGLVVAVALGVPGAAQRQYGEFVNGDPVNTSNPRDRLTRGGDNGRIDQWRVALDGWGRAPLRGQGAGTYVLNWDRAASADGARIQNAHSLYVETLGELGLVGLLLVLSVLLVVLRGFLSRARGPDRVAGGALLGCGLAWALSAGVDWVWELPAVTVWFFAAGGLALAGLEQADDGAGSAPRREATGWPLRLGIAAACLALLVVPARFYLSDRALGDGKLAFARNDCVTAVKRAKDSIARLDVRPESRQLLGYCLTDLGQPGLGARSMAEAERLDPESWEPRYGLAVARAAAGRDPRPDLRAARRLRPGEPRIAYLLRLLDTEDPAQWKRRVLEGVIAHP